MGMIGLAKQLWSIRKTLKRIQNLPQLEKNFSNVEKFISVRARGADYLASAEEVATNEDGESAVGDLLHREEFPGVFSTLVYDFPEARIGIHPDRLTDWGMTYDQLFAKGLANLKAAGVQTIDHISSAGKNKLAALIEQDNPAISAHAFFLGEIPGAAGPHGAIVGIPSSDIIFVYPLETAVPDPARAADLAETAKLVNSACSDPVSQHVYLWTRGTYTKLESDEAGNLILPKVL